MSEKKLQKLLDIINKLRDPINGCPWDREQSFKTIIPYTIEEAYEVAQAISDKNYSSLKDELGDLLFQVVFHSQIAKEKGLFEFEDVLVSISDKMIRRHPHVFGNKVFKNIKEQTLAWEAQKELERKTNAQKDEKSESFLDDIPISLPALSRAVKLQKRAARVGFDWPETSHVIDKMNEEILELSEALNTREKVKGTDDENIREEFGDLLFVCANLARHLKVDPEYALMLANEKFTRRFQYIEWKSLEEGKNIEDRSLDEMEFLWNEAKSCEKTK
ncbi:MAG: nucleoside triphosphate pyrophosphohydrolase [Sphingomonadales bacterium]|jgi:MazG family protein